MLEDAIRYPWTGEQKLETLVIGGVLTLLAVFFIPILFAYGYLVRVIRDVSAGETDVPPVFDDWGELLVDGLVAFVISALYVLVPAAILTVGTLAWILPVSVGAGVGGSGGGAIAVLGTVVSLVLFLLGLVGVVAAFYLVPAGVSAYARTGRLASAFSPSTVWAVGSEGSYAVAWVIAVVIGFLAQIVGGAVSLTVIGVVLVPFVTFYGNVAGAYAIGVGVADTPLATDTREGEAGRPSVRSE